MKKWLMGACVGTLSSCSFVSNENRQPYVISVLMNQDKTRVLSVTKTQQSSEQTSSYEKNVILYNEDPDPSKTEIIPDVSLPNGNVLIRVKVSP